MHLKFWLEICSVMKDCNDQSQVVMKKLFQNSIVMAVLATVPNFAGADVQSSDLEISANKGDPKAQVELAIKYSHAEGVPRDFGKANSLYCRAAKQGYAEGQFKFGWVYANGRGVPRNDSVAAVLFKMAADQGHEYAARMLSVMHALPDVQMPTCLLPDPPPVAVVPEVDTATTTIWAPKEIMELVQRLAPQYAIDSNLALALISVESAFNPSALSPKKAQGLMQLIPETAERFGVKKVFNPDENVKGGLAYLRWLLAFFQGDVSLVLAAYNAGEGAVEKYRGIPPYAETRAYVRKITGIYKKATHPFNPDIVRPSAIIAQTKRM